jgi:hypothetical protein
MSKVLGQRIGIKFTEDLVGKVSQDSMTGLAWERDTFLKTDNTTPRTNGWMFSPQIDMNLTAFMIYSDTAGEVTMHLWQVEEKQKLVDQSFTSGKDSWATSQLVQPIKLYKGMEYIITSNTPINGGYMYSDTAAIVDQADFSSHINMLGAYRIDSRNSFPTSLLDGSYTNSVGFIYEIKREPFTIAGKERRHVGGELIDGDYEVKAVERYPIVKVWEDGFEDGEFNGVDAYLGVLSLEEVDKNV